MKREGKSATFDDELLNLINRSVNVGDVVMTLGRARPNRITWINEDGVWVRTEKSDQEGTGPQLVPAWMIAAAWYRLVQRGRLSQQEILEELNVKRSAFVCALLAHLPDVKVENGTPSQSVELTLSAKAHGETRFGSSHPGKLSGPTSAKADAGFAERLNELLESNPYSTEDFADALSDEGVPMAVEIATRLLAGKGGLPSDSIIRAVARILDVEPEYLLGSEVESQPAALADRLEGHDTPSKGRREYHSETGRTPFGSELAITLQEFGRIVEALSVAADRYLTDPQADIALAAALARTIAALGYELGLAQAEEILITRALLEEVVLTWARTGPSDTASREDFLWAAELLGKG